MQKKTDAYVLPVFSIAKILLAFTGQVHVKVLPLFLYLGFSVMK